MNLGCVSTLLSSIGNSDVLGFANLALESEAWLQERRTNGSAGGVGYGAKVGSCANNPKTHSLTQDDSLRSGGRYPAQARFPGPKTCQGFALKRNRVPHGFCYARNLHSKIQSSKKYSHAERSAEREFLNALQKVCLSIEGDSSITSSKSFYITF
ncbi:hypothetical protein TNCV_263581 [Trichonephila clavipes]|nr:hypothetical protein TNCV_263581 [Trichonephila clavipes]